MIECIPQSLCSWNYIALGLSYGSGEANIQFDWIREQGSLSGADMNWEIQKEGLLDPRWTLEKEGLVAAEATKPSALFRSFEITSDARHWTVSAESPVTRVFQIENHEGIIGSIRPMHPFTRRATIECVKTFPETLQLFSFWLVALLWRRSANNSS